MITAIILAHYKQRQNNLKIIIDSLLAGSFVPKEIVVFIDNDEIDFQDHRVTIIRTSASFLPKIRFALGSYFDTDYCLFIDDDLTVRKNTLRNLCVNALDINDDKAIIGLQGSILGDTPNPYADDTSIKREDRKRIEVDIVLRTYFVPRASMSYGLQLQAENTQLPDISLDDVYLCLGNKYLNNGHNYVIGVNDENNVSELSEHGVGQSMTGEHYENRNKVIRYLMDKYVVSSTK